MPPAGWARFHAPAAAVPRRIRALMSALAAEGVPMPEFKRTVWPGPPMAAGRTPEVPRMLRQGQAMFRFSHSRSTISSRTSAGRHVDTSAARAAALVRRRLNARCSSRAAACTR